MKRVDFLWRCQPVEHSYDARLLSYLRENVAIIPLREKILQALRAFWMPFAYMDQPEGKRLAAEAIYALEKHADYLRSQFGVEVDKRVKPRHREHYIPPTVSQKTSKSDTSLSPEVNGDKSETGEFIEFF
ncbi:hypothetical protein [Coleofasciculus sp. E1-EBD-02]|jgi:hypothetical protein|uniref:hypothetical protein n=1 Tax=Coleofasciculus sp. E1-EBD-02 TaxID=3068481 RepID=UPI00330121A4